MADSKATRRFEDYSNPGGWLTKSRRADQENAFQLSEVFRIQKMCSATLMKLSGLISKYLGFRAIVRLVPRFDKGHDATRPEFGGSKLKRCFEPGR